MRDATEIIARDGVRESSHMARIAAELIETSAMTATLPALEGALKVLREATMQAVGAYKMATKAIDEKKAES